MHGGIELLQARCSQRERHRQERGAEKGRGGKGREEGQRGGSRRVKGHGRLWKCNPTFAT
jgi:hypothetical protein